MKNSLNIPQTIKVGFQNRSDTYSGFLAYVVYLKKDKSIAKETSWKGWCDSKIPTKELPNEPIEGFVLNKKAGGYASGWNHRQTYCRVWDPRGWEVEISIPNLLYILQECNCEKGKGLSGKFVYAWDGKDLILLPTSSEDYIKSKELIEKTEKIKISDLIVGKSYYAGTDYEGVENVQTYLGARNVYIPTVGKFKQHLFLCNKDKTIKGYKSISNKFYYQTEDEAISLADCADYIDKITEDKLYLEKGITVKGFDFINCKSGYFHDILKQKFDKQIEKVKTFRDICLKDPRIENYNNLTIAYQELFYVSSLNILIKENDMKWLEYYATIKPTNYFYNNVYGKIYLESSVRCKEENIIKNVEKLTDEYIDAIGMAHDIRLNNFYEIDKNGKIISGDWNWHHDKKELYEYRNKIKNDTFVLVKTDIDKNTIELTLSNNNKLETIYSKYENGNEKIYRLSNRKRS